MSALKRCEQRTRAFRMAVRLSMTKDECPPDLMSVKASVSLVQLGMRFEKAMGAMGQALANRIRQTRQSGRSERSQNVGRLHGTAGGL